MDDILRRLGIVESSVAETREDMSAIRSVFVHLAAKADLNELNADVQAIKASQLYLGIRTDGFGIRAEVSSLRRDIASMETRIIRCCIGSGIASVSALFMIAKFMK